MSQHSSQASQRGLTLVETIVAILVIASVVIGVAAIYAQRQNVARGGHIHTRAVALAAQMAEVIRQDDNLKHNYETALGATCNSKLSKKDVASNLVACWQDSVEQELTDGSARISLDANAVPAQYVIIVSWSEPRTGTASYVLRVTPGLASNAGNTTTNSDAARAAG